MNAHETAQTDNDHAALSPRTRWLLLFAIILLGLLVRVPRLTESLWYDEIAAYQDYGARGPAAILTTYYDPANHVLHTLLSHYSVEWIRPLSSDEIALRLPALLFSVALIPIMFGWVRSVAGERSGLIAALLAAILPVPILEVEARGYSMMICAAAALAWLMQRMIERPGCLRRAIAYAFIAAAGALAHPVTVLAPIGHGAALAIEAVRRRSLRGLRLPIIALVCGALLTLLVYAPLLQDFLRVSRTFSVESETQPTLLGAQGLHALLGLGGA